MDKKNIDEFENVKLSNLKGLDLKDLLECIKNTKIEYRKKLEIPRNVTFGLEIEVNSVINTSPANFIKQSLPYYMYVGIDKFEFQEFLYSKLHMYRSNGKIDSNWTVISDGTVDAEIVSPILRDYQKTWNEVKTVCEVLKESDCTANLASAAHVHIGAHSLGSDPKSWLNLMKIWLAYEKIIMKFGYGERIGHDQTFRDSEGTNYPLILETKEEMRERMWSLAWNVKVGRKLNEKQIRKIIMNDERRTSINFQNFYYFDFDKDSKNTIEYRCALGTIEEAIWQNYVNAFAKLTLACKDNNLDEDVIEKRLKEFNNKNNEYSEYPKIFVDEALEFCDLIFSNPLDKIYFLKQYIRDFTEEKEPVKRFIK